jgi:putative ABC transport system permease protein
VIIDALVIGHIRSNAWRAFVSVVAIALGVATALGLALTNTLSVQSLDSDRVLFTQRVDLQVLPFGHGLSQNILARVRYLDGVASAMPIVDRPITIGVDRSGSGGDAARLVGVDLVQPLPGVAGFDEGRPGPFARVGSFIDPGSAIGTNGAIVSTATATRLGLKRGNSFTILSGSRMVRLAVANVMPRRATGVDSSVVFVDVATAQAIVHEFGTVDRIDVVAEAPLKTLRPALLNAVGGRARVVVPSPNGFSLGALTGGIEATFGALASIGLAVGGLLVFNAVGTSIEHRRGDIGTLRVLGVTRVAIVMAFVAEGAGYGALGGLFGAAGAEFAIRTVARLAGSNQNLAAYDLRIVAVAVALGIGVAVVSSIAPALGAARMAPALAARQKAFEGNRPGRSRSIAAALAGAGAFALGVALADHPDHANFVELGFPFCFAAGTVLTIPPFWKALGTLVRALTADAPPSLRFAGVTLTAIPRRTGVALAALSVAVFAAVAFDIASDSFATALHAWAPRGFAGDLLVRPYGYEGTFDSRVVARVRATPGVTDVAAIRTIHTQTGLTDVAVRGEDASEPHVMTTEAPAEIGAPLAAELHLRLGDVVALRTAHRDLRVRVSAVRSDFSDARGAIVLERRVLRDAFGDDRIDALRVSLDSNADPTHVENAIARRVAPLRIVTVATRELRDRFTSVFDGTFAFVRTLSIVIVTIASLGVASTLAALVFERRFELRMLRSLGTRRATIVRMLASEALMVALSGCALGTIAAIAFAAVQLYVVDPVTIGFAIPLTVPFASVAAVLSAALAASVVAPVSAAPAAFTIATDRKS